MHTARLFVMMLGGPASDVLHVHACWGLVIESHSDAHVEHSGCCAVSHFSLVIKGCGSAICEPNLADNKALQASRHVTQHVTNRQKYSRLHASCQSVGLHK
jgi:hypothetical protein